MPSVAVLPMVWAAYYRYRHFGLNLPVFYYFINTFVLVLTTALRRPAKRITANPWFWLLGNDPLVLTNCVSGHTAFKERKAIRIKKGTVALRKSH